MMEHLSFQSEHIRTIIKARGISHSNVTGKTFAVFRVDRKHHLMSIVSKIGTCNKSNIFSIMSNLKLQYACYHSVQKTSFCVSHKSLNIKVKKLWLFILHVSHP